VINCTVSAFDLVTPRKGSNTLHKAQVNDNSRGSHSGETFDLTVQRLVRYNLVWLAGKSGIAV
jgi:hypothetical protein